MDILKKPYEISLWEDELVFVGESGKTYTDITLVKEKIVSQFYREIKNCVIGSNTMDSPARCVNPKLVRKMNGENTLTFTMYYQYWDDEAQSFVYNPFNELLVNERKVKLRLGPAVEDENDNSCQWFDFIIKNTQENSETRAFTYTCKDQFVNELSKSGFELVLDNELENNMGTITKLATTILKGSDWELDEDNTSDLKQYKEEPLYKIQLGTEIIATNMLDKTKEITIPENEHIYVFYSNINDKKPQWQFLYTEDGNFKVDDDLLIDREHPNYIIDVQYGENGYPDFVALNTETKAPLIDISLSYRGERLVRQTQTKYDSTIDKYVGVYEKDGKQYYGYTQSEYITSGAVVNYAANPSNFSSTSGWQTDANQLDYKIKTWPEGALGEGKIYQSFIEVDFAGKKNALIMNSGIDGNRSSIEEFVAGEKYVLRMKYKNSLNDNTYANIAPTAKICKYHLDDSSYYVCSNWIDDEEQYVIFHFQQVQLKEGLPSRTNELKEIVDENGIGTGKYEYLSQEDPDYIYMLATCSRGVSKTELADWDFRVGLFFDFDTDEKVYIEDVQVFPYKTYEDEGERLCVPNGKLHSEIKTKYVYYEPNSEMKSIDDLKPVYSEYIDSSDFEQLYGVDGAEGNEFTKVRSISAKESNRFNLIQELCETFECWPKFTVKRNQSTGEIKYDENYRQQKFVSFREFVGKENFVGFRYGINSKSIQRTIDSAAIVSKMIVKDNANEFAPNGFCSIARASENPTGENFLLNFDHYVRHKLLDFDVVTNDLYTNTNGYLGYYTKLKTINADRDKNIDIQSGLLVDISNYDAAYTTYKTSYDSAVEEQLLVEKDILYYTNNKDKNFASSIDDIYNQWSEDEEFNSYWVKWCQCQNIKIQHKPLYEKAKANLDSAKAQYDTIVAYLKNIADQKQTLALQFYKKYSRFIQEGSWIKEDYTDPNLYYLDSESTLHTSAQPKVTYNISVIDVSPLAGYADYEFDIGDRTYIEDTEFFGWSLNNRSAPYREEIVVSEITTELDSPEKNQIKVQNYKTQFEDLFQRITATTQQAEYHTGEYARAASVVETNGTISASTLANSFANNSFKLSNARDQSVVWDSSGITTTSLSNPSEMVRIISGGMFLSNDGGQSWKTGITGSGINTSYLTAGQINTDKIFIMNGNNAAFRWDEKGLAAYYRNIDTNTYNYNKFIRFDHNGLYGIIENNSDNTDYDTLDKIYSNAPFSLTWKGFALNSLAGSIRISSEDDIQVLDQNKKERVKIGKIDENKYGICIKDSESRSVMETDDTGKLWLRRELNIGSRENLDVKIGYIVDKVKEEDETIHAIIQAGDEGKHFIVYEDGSVSATGVTLSGVIEAEEGRIAGLEIKKAIISQNGQEKIVHSLNAEDGAEFSINTTTNGVENPVLLIKNNSLSINGIINALGGTIGGFIINNDSLKSTNESNKLTLNGSTGEMFAQSITLGANAKIQEYIKLGENCYIYNPEYQKNKFIQAGQININADGTANFGSINIDGTKSLISGNNWKITPDRAEFSNVSVSGEIETVVFKKNFVQAAGGAIVFRPSYKIEEINGYNPANPEIGFIYYQLLLDENFETTGSEIESLNIEVQLIGKEKYNGAGGLSELNGQRIAMAQLSTSDNKTIIVKTSNEIDLQNVEWQMLVEVGAPGEFLMGINSGTGDIINQQILGRGLTIAEYKSGSKLPKLFLGDLSKLGNIERYNGFGLYSDNVYLNGSLTTTSSSGGCAGVNTTSGVKARKEVDKTQSNIIFWAGASGFTDEAIQHAPFQVTENGYVYVENSIFAGGSITGANIYAAKIFGNGEDTALKIYDTGIGKGIGFYSNQNSEEIQTCGVDAKGFYAIKPDVAMRFLKQNEVNHYLSMSSKGISYEKQIEGAESTYQASSNIDLSETEVTFNFNGSKSVSVSSGRTKIFNELELGQSAIMQYREARDDGYDLYIIVSPKEE